MPQLDILTFFMQIFFTFLSFWLSFICYRNWVLPETYVVLKQRQTFIKFIIESGILLSSQFVFVKIFSLKLISTLNLTFLVITKDFKHNLIISNSYLKMFSQLSSVFFSSVSFYGFSFKLNLLSGICKKINVNFKNYYLN